MASKALKGNAGEEVKPGEGKTFLYRGMGFLLPQRNIPFLFMKRFGW
jgi:hypothetical protein